MLWVNENSSRSPRGDKPEDVVNIDVGWIWNVIRLRWKLVLGVTAPVSLAVLVYCALATPLFVSTATVMIDARRIQVFRQDKQDNAVVADLPGDSATIDSQVVAIESEAVLLRVVRDLNLHRDPEFDGSQTNPIAGAVEAIKAPLTHLIASIRGLFVDAPALEVESSGNSRTQFLREVMENLRAHIRVRRHGLTQVIEISATSETPRKAASIANAIAAAYIQDQIDSIHTASLKASSWLESRLEELKRMSTEAENETLSFKVSNNLVDVKGALVTDLQLGEISTQLSLARVQTAEAKAKLERMEEIVRSGTLEGGVVDTLRSEPVMNLRAQYLQAAKTVEDLVTKYGEDHAAVLNARREMDNIKQAIVVELKRVAEVYRSDLAIARARENSLEESISELFRQSAESRQAQIQLRQLESASQSYHALYDSLLQRYHLAVQQQSFPIPAARVLTNAIPSEEKNWPKTGPLLGLGLIVGLGLGVGAALVRHQFDRSIRTRAQVEQITGVECFSSMPLVEMGRAVHAVPALDERINKRILPRMQSVLTFAVDQPASQFAHAIRRTKIGIDVLPSPDEDKVIGITSTLNAEGKTTLASNLAYLSALAGERTLLIDADSGKQSLSRVLSPGARKGLLEVLNGSAGLSETLWQDPQSGLHMLPLVVPQEDRGNQGFQLRAMQDCLRAWRPHYDVIIIDLPSVFPVCEIASAAHLFDGILLVVEWGQTQSDALEDALDAMKHARDKMIGTVLNKVDLPKHERAGTLHARGRRHGGRARIKAPAQVS